MRRALAGSCPAPAANIQSVQRSFPPVKFRLYKNCFQHNFRTLPAVRGAARRQVAGLNICFMPRHPGTMVLRGSSIVGN